MLDSKVYVQLGEGLQDLNPLFTFVVTGNGDVIVTVETLKALIVKAEEGKVCRPACDECWSSHEVTLYRDARGKIVAYCFEHCPEGLSDYRPRFGQD